MNAYQQQDFQLTTDTASLLIDIARKSGKKRLLLDSYSSLSICYEHLKLSDLAADCQAQMLELGNILEQELAKYPLEDKWWL